MRTLPLLGLLMAAGVAAAAPVTVDCGRLLDVKAGTWRERVSITVDKGVVVSIAPLAARSGPVSGPVSGPISGPIAGHVDLSAYSCLPGLIDMHVHLTGETKAQVDTMREVLSSNPADGAYRSVPYAERTLKAGFTTVRDLGASQGLNVALKRAIANGSVIGPRMFTSGTTIATSGGHGDPTNNLSDRFAHAVTAEAVVNSPDEARQAVRARYREGADLIKVTATGGVLSQAINGQNAQFTEDELRAVVSTARDYGFRVAAHAHGAEGMKRALRAGVDSIEHGTLMDDEAIALFKKHGTWYVPTISAGRYVADQAKIPGYYSALVQPKAAAIGPLIQATFGRAYRAGVKIAFGTDAAVYPHGDNAKEFAYMVEAGMPPLEAIRSATLGAASLLDQSKTLGSVEPGFAADIVAVSGDPLRDISVLQQMKFVMKAGVVYKQP